MNKDDLKDQLLFALARIDTAAVYRLNQQGANLKDFTIIGIANIKGEWSGNVESSLRAFMKINQGVYYLPLNSIEQVNDDDFIKHFSGLINPGADDSFPQDLSFNLRDLDATKMLDNEHLYQAIINQSSIFHIPYLGICSGSQHLVLFNNGTLKKIPGYIGGNHQANFIYGTVAYFMALSFEEQQKALEKCIFPQVSFRIYTRHNFAAQKEQLGSLTLGAVSEAGIVQAHSKGTTQIGVQFHPENYYFDNRNKINRQKQFLDNFFNLAKKHNEIMKFSLEMNLLEQEIYQYFNDYDAAILTKLEICSTRPICSLEKVPLFFEDDICLS